MNYDPEIADGGTTHYLRLAGPHHGTHDAAVFIPDRFHTTPRVDLILYLHGLPASFADCRAYVGRRQMREIRRAVADNGRYALAVPWLGPQSDAGYLTGGVASFDEHLGQIIRFVAENGPGATSCPVALSLNTLVLSGHSGGGKGLVDAAQLPSSLVARVVEVWAFDCFYWGESGRWISWARAHPAAAFHGFWRHNPHDTRGEGDRTAHEGQRIAAAGLPRDKVTSVEASVPHDEIPNTMFPSLLAGLTAPATP